MIKAAIEALACKKGSSKHAIVKYIRENYDVGDNTKNIEQIVRMTLTRNVDAGNLKQVSGTGASGSFKLAVKKDSPAKKPAAKKPAKKAEAKKAPAKKAAVKKTPIKAAAKKTPARKAAVKK